MGMFSICCHVMMRNFAMIASDTFQASSFEWVYVPSGTYFVHWMFALFPGWWYGVVGHLETCDVIRSLCHCHKSDPSLNMLASGPYGLIFSSFVPFYLGIRVSTRFRIFGINFSNKSFVYLAGLQLSWFFNYFMFFSFLSISRLAQREIGICGVLAVLLYRSNILGVRRIKFPEFVSSFVSRLSWPTLGGSSPPASGGNVIGNIPSYTSHEVEASTVRKLSFRCSSCFYRGAILTIPSGHWFQWDLTGTRQDRHLYRPETTSMWLQTSFLKHNLTNSNPGQ
ncbi:hypothetical protein IFM89_024923 [Coptis chinensis]|uniref:Uncharacterized protein n=1 Tax=Coptis chinensis TaxID=261450 RepID=A0A835LGE1_9MAGN|nr:hypothetical protein IFM89_024923 [Coptis chinensis]